MSPRVVHNQRKMHSRTRGTSFGRRLSCASIPACEQGEPHLGFVGVSRSHRAERLMRYLPVHTGGGLNRSRLFSSRRVRRSRLQFHRIGYQPGSYVSDPFERHRLSQVRGFNTTDPSERHLEPCSLNRGKRFPR